MRILLVDSETSQLEHLKQAFNTSTSTVTSVKSASTAIKALTNGKYDLVISVLSLGKISGEDLLKVISHKFPTIVRVAINNHYPVKNYNGTHAHFVYALPLDNANIRSTIEGLVFNKKAITKDSIVKAVANIKTLPSPPMVYLQLNAILKEANTDSQKISEIISQDPALAAKVLQFSNKNFMPKGKLLNSIADAITKMGIDTLCCIVMTAELFSYEPDIPGFSLLEEQLHCLATAKLAASMVKPELKQEAMIAGLLHDIGKVVLFEINPKLTLSYMENRSSNSNNNLLEKRIFGTDHCHIGAYLLHTWSFSYSLIAAVISHHDPEKLLKESFGVAQAVYLANTLLRNRTPTDEFVKHYKMESILEKLQLRAARLM